MQKVKQVWKGSTPLPFKILVLLLLLICKLGLISAQNMVLNSGFEEYTRDSVGGYMVFYNGTMLPFFEGCRVLIWSSPTDGTPDYMHTQLVPPLVFSNPSTIYGFQFANSGDSYANLYSNKEISPTCLFMRREYIQGKLIEPLEAGKDYVFGFYTVLAEISTHASKIGVGFTQDSVYYNTMDCLIGEGFYPNLESTTFYTDTLNWTKMEWVYTASGGERFFTVGNFWCDSSESYLYVDTIGYTDCHASSYFIDDFYMYELIDSMAFQDMYIPNIFSPNNDGQNDVFRIRGAGIAEIKQFLIYDRWGKEVFACRTSTPLTVTSPECGWNGTYHGEDAPVGVYVYYVEVVLLKGEAVVKRGNVTFVR